MLFAQNLIFFTCICTVFVIALLITDDDHGLMTRADEALDRLHLRVADWLYWKRLRLLTEWYDLKMRWSMSRQHQRTALITLYFDDPALGQCRTLDQIVYLDQQSHAVLVFDMIQLEAMFDRRQQTLDETPRRSKQEWVESIQLESEISF